MKLVELRSTALGAALVAVSVVAVVVFSVSAARTPQAHAAQIDNGAEKVLPSFSAKGTSADALPSFLASGPQSFAGIDAKSARRLGTDQGVLYWAAKSEDGKVCVIALLPGADQLASETCGNPDSILKSALGLQIITNDGKFAINAYLMPPGYAAAAPYHAVGTQLAVGDARTMTVPTITKSTTGSVGDAEQASASPSLQPFDFGLASTSGN